jgi:ABC-type Fe3+-hydroxamate transport system substrate-binding protein
VKVSLPLKRIVSLVPSQTELLIYLGLEEKIVGRTKFCIHPKSQVKGIPIVGGTKTVNHDKILAIRPDIIIGNKEENTKEDIDTLSKDFPVWLSDINNLDNALGMILSLSEIFDKSQKGQMLVDNITSGFHSLEGRLEISVLYLIWEKPYMGVGNDTFINDIIIRAGYKNALSNR